MMTKKYEMMDEELNTIHGGTEEQRELTYEEMIEIYNGIFGERKTSTDKDNSLGKAGFAMFLFWIEGLLSSITRGTV